MAAKIKRNALGLGRRDYEFHFAAWKVPRIAIEDGWLQNRTFADLEAYLVHCYGEKARPARQKMLRVNSARILMEKHQRRLALRLWARRMTPETRQYLAQFLPEKFFTGPPATPRTELELFEDKHGKLVDNRVYEHDANGVMREASMADVRALPDVAAKDFSGIFTKFD